VWRDGSRRGHGAVRSRETDWTTGEAEATAPRPIVRWSVRRATLDLRGLVVETSFGYALGLELARELVFLQLYPSFEDLVAYAEQMEAALLARGWQCIDHDDQPLTQERA
jgi:hypothetical protein